MSRSTDHHEAGPFDDTRGLISNSDSQSSPPRRTTNHKASSSSISFADQISLNEMTSPEPNAFRFENFSRRSQSSAIPASQLPSSQVPPIAQRARSPQTPSTPLFSDTSTVVESPSTPGFSRPLLSPQQRDSPLFNRNGLPTMPEDEQDISTENNTPYRDHFPDGITMANVDANHQESNFSEVREIDDHGKDHGKLGGCPSDGDIFTSRKHWLSISILCLSIYSTVFSGIYLVLAIIQPRYGSKVQSGGSISPETASVIFAFFAKTIELSFVSVFVAFLGQVLSRRSLVKSSRGITLAELTMRTWVIQPGFMITHGQTLKYAGFTILGMITLTNAFVAMFYTTASDSLVSPHLRFGDWKNQVMHGKVKTQYANPVYIGEQCRNPTLSIDKTYGGTTCLQILHAGQAHSNHIVYLDDWVTRRRTGGISSDLSHRPKATALLHHNTTVTGSWALTEWSNVTESYIKYKRVINNVTMVMPHPGIFDVARAEKNAILQPEHLGGVGEYKLRAAVASPAINVLCVNMNNDELHPLVYTNWPNANVSIGDAGIPGQRLSQAGHTFGDVQPSAGQNYLNSTIVDDVFGWGEKYHHQPPVFPNYPIAYNSVINVSMPYEYDVSIYLLTKPPDSITTDYSVCKLRSFLFSECSTHYTVSGTTGGKMESHCEDHNDDMAYIKHNPNAPAQAPQSDWMNVGSEWLRALAFGTGISNADAASSRLLSQLVTVEAGPKTKLSPQLPSIAESLAVMAGSTLLLSAMDSPFSHYWGYEIGPQLEDWAEQNFTASIKSQEYTSGPIQQWTIVFYLVLAVVFATNVFCLLYFIIRSGLVTDFSEPQNLFTLAVNSPESRRLWGSCGAGPEGEQFVVDWHVLQDGGSRHFYIKEGNHAVGRQRRSLRSESSYSKLSSKRKSWL
ncbi:hypothetical protein B0O99DRAFT_689178 [Bisporella sp. PMI_857]|nr:hypothetical protein B0O99DRAFT_689178 [Bisporella sp. PMI_857]